MSSASSTRMTNGSKRQDVTSLATDTPILRRDGVYHAEQIREDPSVAGSTQPMEENPEMDSFASRPFRRYSRSVHCVMSLADRSILRRTHRKRSRTPRNDKQAHWLFPVRHNLFNSFTCTCYARNFFRLFRARPTQTEQIFADN